MDSLLRDVRYGIRQMAEAPLLSAVAILVLTVGVGTTMVVFSVLAGAFFRGPPGVGDIDRLVEVWSIPTTDRPAFSALSYPEFLAYRDQRSVFAEVAVYRGTRVALRRDRGPEMVSAELASSDYFRALDVRMELGTGFVPGDDRPGAGAATAVLGYAYWRGRMGGLPDVVGRTIEVNGRPYTVVGVAPEGFYGAGGRDDPVALWLPAAHHPLMFPGEESLLTGQRRAFWAVARLREDVSVARAEAVAQAAWRDATESVGTAGTEGERRIELTPYRGVGSREAEDAFVFVGVVGGLIGGLILLIACVNVSGILLSRALGRSREIGVRLAMGAGRRRIVRQLLTESLLLAGTAGATAALVAFWTLGVLERRLFTFPIDLSLDLPTLALTLGVTGVAGVAIGLVPALHATRASVFTAMKADVAGSDRRSSRMRDAFTVTQLALTLPLLTGAGLLVGQVVTAIRSDYGVADPERVLAVRLDLGQAGYATDEVGALLSGIRERVTALPGVAGAAFTSAAPFLGGSWRFAFLPSAGDARTTPPGSRPFRMAVVDPGYFSTMGIPILRGRGIEPSDAPGAPVVAVVGEDVARRAWPGQDPLGRILTVTGQGDEETRVTVVGVARSVNIYAYPSEESPIVYAARRQLPDTASMTLVVRAVGEAGALAPAVRAEISSVDPDIAINAGVLGEGLRAGRRELSHGAAGAVACGLIALLLACVGLYGTMATGVADRTREIGVRIALGADRARVVGHFMRKGLVLTLIALGVGLPLSWATVSLVGASVVGVSGLEPAVAVGLTGVAILMTAVALLASWLPARRTSAVDPVLALRTE